MKPSLSPFPSSGTHFEPRTRTQPDPWVDSEPIEWCQWKCEDRILLINTEKCHPAHFIIQRDPDPRGSLAFVKASVLRGRESFELPCPVPHCPDALLWAELDLALPLHIFSRDPYGPSSSIHHLHLPVVSPWGVALAAQHAAPGVKSLREAGDVLQLVLSLHAFAVIRQDKVTVGCVWIQNHRHCGTEGVNTSGQSSPQERPLLRLPQEEEKGWRWQFAGCGMGRCTSDGISVRSRKWTREMTLSTQGRGPSAHLQAEEVLESLKHGQRCSLRTRTLQICLRVEHAPSEWGDWVLHCKVSIPGATSRRGVVRKRKKSREDDSAPWKTELQLPFSTGTAYLLHS